ncbi:MAG: inositol monophosphatase family protein [Thermoleophilia bacterium]
MSGAGRGGELGRGAAPDWLYSLVDGLAAGLRGVVLPGLGLARARGLAGRSAGGDTTFTIDEAAESFLADYLTDAARPVAVYSEDRGFVSFGAGPAEFVLVVDPIDGTRPAAAGFEAACVSIAAARALERPLMADVVYGVVLEIKEGGVFRAVRGAGVEMIGPDGAIRPLLVSENTDLSRLFWTIGFRGRPAVELATALGGLIDLSSVDGAVFDIGSATYSMTRLLTGQLDAYIDVGPRMIELAPWVEARFREVGKGSVLNNSPYDVAASTLILQEAGCVVTDAAGRPLDHRPLLGADMAHQMSVVASATGALHEALLPEVAQSMEAFVKAGAR